MLKFLKILVHGLLYLVGIFFSFIACMFLFVEHDTFNFVLALIYATVFFGPAILISLKDKEKEKKALAESRARYEAKLQAEKDAEIAWLNGEGKGYQKIIDNFYVNETSQKIRIDNQYFDWEKIIGSQIISDEEVISTSVSNGYQTGKRGSVGRAVVGGLLFGGVGAIVGANTGKQKTATHSTTTSTSNNYCKSLILRIYIDSISEPYYDVTFVNRQLNKNNEEFKRKNDELNKCNSIIKIILNRMDQTNIS